MSDVALRMDRVYKKFRKGQMYDSLRDLIPTLTGKLFRQDEIAASRASEFWALQDICFEAKKGQSFGIIGRNGAGKSTMLKLLSRIMRPTKGTLSVNGRLSALIEVAAGFHPDLTGRENIYLNGAILGMSRREVTSKLDEIIAFSGLEEFIDTPVKRYSSGMYARLGFSVAAHVDPDVMIVDEVLSVGDYVFQNRCLERMRTVVRNGTTVLFVSHNLQTVSEFCDQCLLLDHGRQVAIDKPADAIRKYFQLLHEPSASDGTRAASIARVAVRNEAGETLSLRSGECTWIDIDVTASEELSKLSLVLFFVDSNGHDVFNTSTERLGYGTFSIRPGQTRRFTFELTVNMARGTYHLCVAVYRYDIQKQYDRKQPAAIIYVGHDADVRGTVNCFPVLRRPYEGQVLPARDTLETELAEARSSTQGK